MIGWLIIISGFAASLYFTLVIAAGMFNVQVIFGFLTVGFFMAAFMKSFGALPTTSGGGFWDGGGGGDGGGGCGGDGGC
ncbi:hypothetical protein HBA55_36930 [Pseudomaricurvus alkylphenolicus]|uniref:hypothetical protein n=1 Tax=Pseudomaricurvus alkylphenolicus TaxID=1306991 RepID=UPI00141E4233|nr:hypothetical protein [Pseudomaricurvus alkylphenolicus]NIB45217.1 hypothetical protein [Pseudomaricurvus alkylphenolicus]